MGRGKKKKTEEDAAALPASVRRISSQAITQTPIPYITTYIEKVDEHCVTVRGHFGGLGTRLDRRLARERSKAMEEKIHAEQPPGPAQPKSKSKQPLLDMNGEGAKKNRVARFFYNIRFYLWIGCCPPLPRPVIQKIVFQPPREPSYTFCARDGTVLTRHNIAKVEGDSRTFRVSYTQEVKETVFTPIDLSQMDGFIVRKPSGGHVAAVHLPCNGAAFTMLYSHANAIDLGYSIPILYKIRRKLACAVIAYDYSGYGLSTGKCTEDNLYEDVDAVFDHVTKVLKLAAPNTIVAFGFSLGTCATAHLAARVPDLAAVVLSGAFISAINILRRVPTDRNYACECQDRFRTYERVGKIKAPTLVIHGMDDEVAGVEHGLWILERCQRPLEPLFLPDTRHNDMDKPAVWSRLRQMVAHDLKAPQPHAALRTKFQALLTELVPDLHPVCLLGPAVCLQCRSSLAKTFFDPKRMAIIALTPAFVANARRIRWEVEPKSSADGGSWDGRFTLILYSALASVDEIRLLAHHNNVTFPEPPNEPS